MGGSPPSRARGRAQVGGDADLCVEIAAVVYPLLFLAWLPSLAGLWGYVTLLLGLERLGRADLRLLPFEEDRSLGLKPLGSLASGAFLFLSLGLVPLVLASSAEPVAALVNLVLFGAAGALFVASMWRLRRRMVAAKAAYLVRARRLLAEAYRPATQGWSLQALVAQSAQISAAEALERRVSSIQEWPFDEGMLRTTAAVATSVVAAIFARLILSRVGL